jgi:hypothetical protein
MVLGVTQKAHTRAEPFRTDCDAAIGKEKGLGIGIEAQVPRPLAHASADYV